MKKRKGQIGIDRLVRLDWVERTSFLVLGGNTPADIKSTLQDDLHAAFQFGQTAKRGSLSKTITILMKVWSTTPHGYAELRDAGLELIKGLSIEHRKAVHWGMVMAVYPFWADVAGLTGRLLRLQEKIGASHIQRRIREKYGERETVSRATQRVLRSFFDWGILLESGVKGIYEVGPPLLIQDQALTAWLIEALLVSGTNRLSTLESLINSTALFPFRFPRISACELLSASKRLEVITHNLGEELVVLKRSMAAQDT